MSGIAADRSAVDAAGASGLGMREFVMMCGALTAIPAMSIDMMLPALPAMGADFGIVDANARQMIVTTFIICFAASQIVFGPISDRFGRKPLMIGALVVYVLASASALVTTGFVALLAARAIQGLAAACLRVVIMAVVRDCFSGVAMGRIMTFIFIIFMMVPIVAPLVGQTLTDIAGWRAIFVLFTVLSLLLLLWLAIRFGETLSRDQRQPLSFATFFSAMAEIVTNRVAVGYTIAATLATVGLFSYIVSVQQVYGELYGLGKLFPVAFAASSTGVAIVAFMSTRLLKRFGLKRVTHTAYMAFAASGLALCLLAGILGTPPFVVTFVLLAICMAGFGVLQGNSGAIALEPLGHIAGVASSLFGVVTTTAGAIGGGLVGQAYNGTIMPLALAFGVGGALALATTLAAEKGRLFR